MKIYRLGVDTPPTRERACALGFFDGVHLGHRRIIERCVGRARELGLTPSVFTFFGEGGGFKPDKERIYTTEERLEILASLGIEEAFVANFESFSAVSAGDFVTDFLFGTLGVRLTVCGFNFRFGRGALGDAALLSELMRELGGEAITEPEFKFENKTLSSSEVRRALAEGRTEKAEKMLGAPYSVKGKISHGLGLGRALGFPTVNIPLSEASPLKNGVYLTRVELDTGVYDALTNVGVCPTVGGRGRHIEAHLIDFSGEIYGSECRIYFIEFLREETEFPSLEGLKAQITKDLNGIKEIKNVRKLD